MIGRQSSRYPHSPNRLIALTRFTLQQALDDSQGSIDSDGDTSSFLNEFPLSRETAYDQSANDVSSFLLSKPDCRTSDSQRNTENKRT